MSQTLQQPVCKECNNRRFVDERAYQNHLNRSHNKPPVIYRRQCPSDISKRWQRRNKQHVKEYQKIKRINGMVNYDCGTCGLHFDHGSIARVHGKLLGHRIVMS